ncbi:hypothetical protein BSKO_08177 [Bryopsis sp. KO-2023]|nr:hypothetical protein BSKO_08177 [Bryopsis sp. KO-2023]
MGNNRFDPKILDQNQNRLEISDLTFTAHNMEETRVPLYDVEKSSKATTVCVTGATGYVAGPIVQRLLASGHTVHATCRDPQNEASVAHLKKLPGADERLKLFRADLLEEGSFEEAVAGCSCVMHTASPFVANVPRGKEREVLIDPALKGTENVIAAVNATDCVERLIVTSSCTAIHGDPAERGPDHVFTEDDWTIKASEKELPYPFSKKVAEQRAYELCKEQTRWDLVTFNPGVVCGPPLGSRPDGESVNLIKVLMTGKAWPVAPKIGMGFIDVRDVAAAHCVAMADKSANGRYILCNGSLWILDFADLLRPKYPKVWLPKANAPKAIMRLMAPLLGLPQEFITHLYDKIPQFDNSKIKGLGLKFIDPADTLDDMVKAVVELGIITVKQ